MRKICKQCCIYSFQVDRPSSSFVYSLTNKESLIFLFSYFNRRTNAKKQTNCMNLLPCLCDLIGMIETLPEWSGRSGLLGLIVKRSPIDFRSFFSGGTYVCFS